MGVNIGDILFTLVYFVFLILIISLIVRFFKRKFSSTENQSQIINQKLDKILERLEEIEREK